jgi:enoyl-CoA hydratase
MTEFIKTKRDGAAVTITIDRAGDGNLLTIAMVGELAAAFRSAGATDAKVVVLRTAGSEFCRGRDPRGSPPSPTALDMRANLVAPILDLYEAIARTPQPIVCAVQGLANGLGCAIATACDITIAADVARFRLPEMEKDLPPTLAISAMMPRVPRKALTWMVYSMELIDAQTALQIGIASKVVAASQLDHAVTHLVTELCNRSREALVAVKDYTRTAPNMEPHGAADYAANLLAAVLSSAQR